MKLDNEIVVHKRRYAFLLTKAYLSGFFKVKKSGNHTHFIFSKGNNYDLRSKHVRESFNLDNSSMILNMNSNEAVYYKRSIKIRIKQLRLFLCFLIPCLSFKKYKTKYDINWLVSWYIKMNQVLLLSDNKKASFIFYFPYLAETYLTAFYAQISCRKVYFVFSGTTLYIYNRYTYLPNAIGVLCSKFQKYELNAFRKNIWTKIHKYEHWGPEEVDDYNNLIERSPEFDIAIYSTGFWARKENLLRENNLEELKSKDFSQISSYRLFEKILNTIVKIKEANPELKVVLFPHPHERKLYKVHDIEPPYYNKLKDYKIHFETKGENSISRIYDSKLAVSISSTACTDRWNLDLKAFVFDGRQREYRKVVFLKREFLGEFASSCYRSMNELEEMIYSELELNEQ